MNILKALNLGLAFFLELFMLIAFVWGGFSLHVSTGLKVLIGIGVPLVVVVIWGMYFAPNSNHRLATPWLQLAIFALYGIAAFVLARGASKHAAITFLTLGLVNLLLSIIWKQ